MISAPNRKITRKDDDRTGRERRWLAYAFDFYREFP
jgi:hypothetical protein